jgi:hypothetical protein
VRASAIWRETWRDLVSGTARAGLGFVCLLFVVTAFGTLEALAVRDAVGQALVYRASGASTVTLTALGRIDAAACHQLADLPDVEAAGAIRRAETDIVPAALPRGTVPTYDVTPGFGGLVSAEGSGEAGLLLSDQAAALSSGLVLTTKVGAADVAGTFSWPRDGRRPGYGYAALQLTPAAGTYDECWVHAWPLPSDLAAIIHTTLTPGQEVDDEPAVLSQLNTTIGTRFTGGQTFDDRPTRHAPVLASVLGAVIGYAGVRARRVQLAGALHDGLSRMSMLIIIALQTCAWVLLATAVAAAAAVVAAVMGPAEAATSTIVVCARVAVPAAVAAFLAALAAALASCERHLVRYVKDR